MKLVIFFTLIACSLLVISYSILVNFYFEKGLMLSVQHRLELEAAAYAEAYAKDKEAKYPEAANFTTIEKYADLPAEIRQEIAPSEFGAGDFYLVIPDKEKMSRLSFVLSFQRSDGKILYFVYSLGHADKFEPISSVEHGILYYTIAAGILSFLAIILVAVYMIRRIGKLVMRLTDWAFHLDKDNVDDPVGDFEYTELNRLAELFQKNMRRLLQGVQREQRFLRNASHELRTPVAVMQTNMDWLCRLGAGQDERYKRPLDGMRKAVNNMKELMSTFLWVGRKDAGELPRQIISVNTVLSAIIEDNSYLLANKDVQLETAMEPGRIIASESLVRIVWSNIIRNAFQHTYEGEVRVDFSKGVLSVRNDLVPNISDGGSDSFGLGLMLIQDLTDCLGWKFDVEETESSYSVVLDMSMAMVE